MAFMRKLLARLFRRRRKDRDDASIYPMLLSSHDLLNQAN